MTFSPTPAHEAIFSCITDGKPNIVVVAVAGSGKTSTCVESMKLIRPSKRVITLAFNKKIKDEMEKRVPSFVQARTMNSIGSGAWSQLARQRGFPERPKVDTDRTWNLAKELMLDSEFRIFGATVCKMVGLAKQSALIPAGTKHVTREGLLPDTHESWEQLAAHYDVEIPEGVDFMDVMDASREVLDEGLAKYDVIDFNDQLYMSYAYDAPFFQNDVVFVDEAQDLTPLQHEMLARSLRRGGQVVAVGDPCQAIYGFRGADSDSMNTLKRRFNCEELPLHVSYRCPQAVVRFAQDYVEHIQAHASAPDGIVDKSNKRIDTVDLRGGDMVVCRLNAPLVAAAYSLIRKQIPAVVLGREIGAGLLALIKKLKPHSLDDLEAKLDAFVKNESAKLSARGKDDQLQKLQDKADTLRVFIEMADELHQVEGSISRMFTDVGPESAVTLSSVHKSKGLESNRVFILDFALMPSRMARMPWQQVQENNLIYVAITRAKKELHLIRST